MYHQAVTDATAAAAAVNRRAFLSTVTSRRTARWPLRHETLPHNYRLYTHAIQHLCLHLFSDRRFFANLHLQVLDYLLPFGNHAKYTQKNYRALIGNHFVRCPPYDPMTLRFYSAPVREAIQNAIQLLHIKSMNSYVG